MPTLPDWVLRYKTKGIYVKKSKTGYALYRGHSERVAGKSYPVFRCDEYLGIVTEQDGLVPSRPPVKAGIKVLRYGFCQVAEASCNVLRRNPQRLGLDADVLFVKAVLGFEGRESQTGYEGSWLSILFPGLDLNRSLNEREERFLSNLRRQVESKLGDSFGDDGQELLSLCPNLYAVHVNGLWHLSDLPDRLRHLASKYSISLELGGGMYGV
jgi:hypothetical protein